MSVQPLLLRALICTHEWQQKLRALRGMVEEQQNQITRDGKSQTALMR